MDTELRHRGAIVHREGRTPLLGFAALLVACLLWLRGHTGRRSSRAASLLSLGSLTFVAQFFRHPSCLTPVTPDLVIAPAYGRVVHVGTEEEPEVLGDQRLRVSIFLSLFDPHLTRSPIAGRIVYQRYHPGRYLVALHPKSSTLNERNSIAIKHHDGTLVLVRQIAGLVARRICSYARVESYVSAGEELGFIKLGSRVDVFVPAQSDILVRKGQYVSAGQTPIARLALRVE
ncbi:MAG: phosphatidylserine decarboxylase family protein [Chloroflexota bacterium]